MKNLKNLGKALSKAEQKEVNGGKSGCFDLFFGQSFGNRCFVPRKGFGVVVNGQCCF